MRFNFSHGLDDDIRDQALRDFWKENRNFLIAAVVVLFASFGATKYYQMHKAESIQQQAIAYYEASQKKSAEEFSKLAKGTTGGYQAMALFEVAKAQIAEKNYAEAAKTYGQIRENGATALLRDLAAVMENQLLMATDPQAAEKGLKELVAKKSPYMLTAMELLAILAQNQEKYDVAQGYYEQLLNIDTDPALAMRSRIEKRLGYLKGKGLITPTQTAKGATN